MLCVSEKGYFMKVVVKVIGGRNAGKEYDLTQPPTDDAHYVLCEDDVLQFTVQTINNRPSIHLALHEIFIPPTSVYPPTDTKQFFEYRWEPKRIGYNDFRSESFFHNFCGIAELLIVDKIQTSYDSFELENLQQLQPIEVLARKINADRIGSMLDFLARNDGRDLAALARITRKYSGFQEGDKTLTYTLDRIEQYLNFLEDALQIIVRKPIAKLVQKNTMKPYTRFSNITEDSINHIISSPEHIYEVEREDESLFSIEDRYFSVDKILETEIVEETNLYENQVLHGFVEILLIATDDIVRRLGEVKVKKTSTVIQGYESLFNKLNQFSVRLNQPCIERCNDFNRRLRKLKRMLNTRLKVKALYTSQPYFTHKAKQNLHYQKIFLMMIEWMRFGSPDWSLQNELNSIQDLSKLFEFYLFCVTKEHVLNCSRQFNGGLVASPIDGSNDSRFVFRVNEEIKAELFYEPNIFHADAEDALLPNYRNTEAWKRKETRYGARSEKPNANYGRNDGFRLRVDSPNVQKMYRIRRTPDVVLRFQCHDEESLLIMDAKYMVSQKAFHEAMPDCVMKYLHGIHLSESGKNASIGLMIVNPDEEDITRHYHHDEYSIFGPKVVTPAIMTASIDVAKAHKFGSTIQRDLFRFMELMAEKVSKNGLGEAVVEATNLYQVDAATEANPQIEEIVEVAVQAKEIEPEKKIKIHVSLKKPEIEELKPVEQSKQSVAVDVEIEPKVDDLPEIQIKPQGELVDVVGSEPVEPGPIEEPVETAKTQHNETKPKPKQKIVSAKRKKVVSKAVMGLPTGPLFNIKPSDKDATKGKRAVQQTGLAMLEAENAENQDMNEYQDLLNNFDIPGRYSVADKTVHETELAETLTSLYGRSIAHFVSQKQAIVYPEFPKETIHQEETLEMRLVDNNLVSDDLVLRGSILFTK